MTSTLVALIAIAVLVFVVLIKGAIIVPQKSSFIIERLGKYHCTLDAGFHILIPICGSGRIPIRPEGAGGGHPRPDLHHQRQCEC